VRVTKIEKQKHHPERKSVFADGKFLTGLSAETLLRSGLRTGDSIDPATLASLQKTEGLLSAKNAALRFLSYRPRTVRELRDKLREKEYAEEEITRTIDDLKRVGLLNDEEFARMYVRNATQLKPTGKILLKRKMLLLGLEPRIIEEALADTLQETDQDKMAMDAAKRFLGRGSSIGKRREILKDRKRLGGYLARRGFTWSVIEPVLNKSLPLHGRQEESE
jgi:regulatory protein